MVLVGVQVVFNNAVNIDFLRVVGVESFAKSCTVAVDFPSIFVEEGDSKNIVRFGMWGFVSMSVHLRRCSP